MGDIFFVSVFTFFTLVQTSLSQLRRRKLTEPMPRLCGPCQTWVHPRLKRWRHSSRCRSRSRLPHSSKPARFSAGPKPQASCPCKGSGSCDQAAGRQQDGGWPVGVASVAACCTSSSTSEPVLAEVWDERIGTPRFGLKVALRTETPLISPRPDGVRTARLCACRRHLRRRRCVAMVAHLN